MKVFLLFNDDNEDEVMYSVHRTEEGAKEYALKHENDLVEALKDLKFAPLVQADLKWTRDEEANKLYSGMNRTYSGFVYTVKELEVL